MNICSARLLVALVSEQGAKHRKVYLPTGSDWYNYWTNERIKGGQTIITDAPIDTISLFVQAGSIVPLGSPILSAQQPQAIASVRVYPGANGSFTLFAYDGGPMICNQPCTNFWKASSFVTMTGAWLGTGNGSLRSCFGRDDEV